MDLTRIPTNDVLTQLVIALSVALIVWYLVGAQFGRRQATRLAHLAADLLRPLGTEGSFRWLGSAGCELRLTRVRKPFKELRVVIWLEPREMLPVWLINRLRGRRDLFALAANLAVPPATEFELVDTSTAVGRRALAKAKSRGFEETSESFANRPLTLASTDLATSRSLIMRIGGALPVSTLKVSRLAVASDPPHLSFSISEPASLQAAGAAFASWLTAVAEAVSGQTNSRTSKNGPRPD